jgi:hypothetical protein
MVYIHGYFKAREARHISFKEYLEVCHPSSSELQACIGRFYFSIENLIKNEEDVKTKQQLQNILNMKQKVRILFWWCGRRTFKIPFC